jgi:hypothetical protein
MVLIIEAGSAVPDDGREVKALEQGDFISVFAAEDDA